MQNKKIISPLLVGEHSYLARLGPVYHLRGHFYRRI